MQTLEILQSGYQPLGAEGGNDGQLHRHCALLAHHGEGIALHRIELGGDTARVGQASLGQFYPAP
ncbi:hypothetical protein D9M68_888840 [compost metagenome]